MPKNNYSAVYPSVLDADLNGDGQPELLEASLHLFKSGKIPEEDHHRNTHHLGMNYYVNFLGHLGSNGFLLKWRFGIHRN